MNSNQAMSQPNASQSKPRKRRNLTTITGVLLIACMHPPVASAGSTFPDQSEQKPVVSMEHHATVAAPPTSLSREEIEEDIQALESERSDLLAKYASAHPDVRSVERRLKVRRQQLEMLKQAPNPAK